VLLLALTGLSRRTEEEEEEEEERIEDLKDQRV